jgi:hypothetical protein
VVTLGVLAAGCGTTAPAAAPSSTVADGSRVDMCSILSNQELSELGIDLNSRKPVNRLGLVGCGWLGEAFTLDLERDKDNLASYQARPHDPAFTSFGENTVNGRPGVHFSVRRQRTDCTQLIAGGPVSLWVAVAPAGLYSGPPINPCAEALRIAQMIEPRLPKAGS